MPQNQQFVIILKKLDLILALSVLPAIVQCMNVIDLINEVAGAELQAPVKAAIATTNSTLAGCNVHTLFRGSYVDLETGRHGARWLLARILMQAGSVHDAKLHDAAAKRLKSGRSLARASKAVRNYVSAGMTTEQLIAAVRAVNGADKYPDKTIRQNLSIVMRRAGQVATLRLPVTVDRERGCKTTRKLWFLVNE